MLRDGMFGKKTAMIAVLGKTYGTHRFFVVPDVEQAREHLVNAIEITGAKAYVAVVPTTFTTDDGFVYDSILYVEEDKLWCRMVSYQVAPGYHEEIFDVLLPADYLYSPFLHALYYPFSIT